MYVLSKLLWFFATPSNALVLATLTGVLLAATRWRRTGLGIALAGLAGLLVGGLSPLAHMFTLPLEERFPVFVEDGRPVAGAIVLGGAVQADETMLRGQLTVNEAAERVIALADLARRYPQAKIVFTGGTGELSLDRAAEADGLLAGLPALGIGSHRILIERKSRTTYENALFTRALVDPKPGETWLLVTSAWHMPRAMTTFRRAGFAVTAYPVDFRTKGERSLASPFGAVADGLRRLDLVTKEWVGLVVYRLVGYSDEVLPGP